MNLSIPPLQSLTIKWLEHLEENRLETGARISASLSPLNLSDTFLPDQIKFEIQNSIRQALWPLVSSEILKECSTWLLSQGDFPNAIEIFDLCAEIEESSKLVPLPIVNIDYYPNFSINPYSWIIPCISGGILGGFFIPHAYFGALTGSTIFIAGLAWVLRRKELAIAFGNTRSRSMQKKHDDPEEKSKISIILNPKNIFRRILILALEKLASLFIRAEPIKQKTISLVDLRQAIEDDYNSCAKFILAICWTHATARPKKSLKPDSHFNASDAVYDAIGAIEYALSSRPNDLVTSHRLASELVQTMANEGYTWKMIAEGEFYSQDMRREFETFGHVEEGQPVKTLKRALCHNGSVISPGTVKRIRG